MASSIQSTRCGLRKLLNSHSILVCVDRKGVAVVVVRWHLLGLVGGYVALSSVGIVCSDAGGIHGVWSQFHVVADQR